MQLKPNDVRSSIVVFLVALPLCLGIALASNAPLSAGIISGIIGGLVIGALGGSAVSVSGPAAGLTVIVAAAISELGGMPAFAMAVFLAGIMHFLFGYFKAGELGNFFPASVVKGMLAAIGLILILKQLPHAVGWDADFMGDESFGTIEGNNTFTDLLNAIDGKGITNFRSASQSVNNQARACLTTTINQHCAIAWLINLCPARGG
jgi:SulP family sulfate permease